jgi:ABC-type Fe3+ transport system permease subunit
MSENELGKALLRGEDPIDLNALTQGVLRRDRRKMWFLGIACLLAWMSVVMLPWATILPMLAKINEYQMEPNHGNDSATAEQRAQSMLVVHAVKVTFVLSISSMFVAALCTVSLIIMSRRATLRQVNVRLAEISAQLKALPRESK